MIMRLATEGDLGESFLVDDEVVLPQPISADESAARTVLEGLPGGPGVDV